MKDGPRRLNRREVDAIREVHARAAQCHLSDLTRDTPARDEITGTGNGREFSHRLAAGRGGGYRPANGLWVTRKTHDWLHGNPELAYAGGWHVETWGDLWTRPVWLARVGQSPGPGWYLIEDRGQADGGPHVVMWCDDQPPQPVMPPTEEGPQWHSKR